MGHQRRLTSRAVTACLLLGLCAAAGAGCANEEREQRRELLTPSKAHQQAAARRHAKPAMFDAAGDLLQSSEKVGEIVLPVGLELRSRREHEWRFKTSRVNWEALVKYFDKRLVSLNYERLDGAVSFGNAALKQSPYAKQRYTVVVEELKGSLTSSRVMIRRHTEERPKLTPAQADAKLEEQRKNAI